MPIDLLIVCGCLCATTTDLSSCDRDSVAHTARAFTIWPLEEFKGLLNSGLKQQPFVSLQFYQSAIWAEIS